MCIRDRIVKGAHASESHQTTRVLTLSDHHNSEVVPVLYIDENDVKASHATTLGQPDENQLYLSLIHIWIQIPIPGMEVTLQPSEFAKIFMRCV